MKKPAAKQRRNSRPREAQSLRITITTTTRVHEHLQTLRDTGLFGTSVAETAERLICDGLLRRVKQHEKQKGKHD